MSVCIYDLSVNLLTDWFKGFEKNFDSYGPDRLDSAEQPYDFDSLMHYDNQAFSKNGENTLQSIADPKRSLGNMDNFSAIDIKQLLKYYPCKPWDKKPTAQIIDNNKERLKKRKYTMQVAFCN